MVYMLGAVPALFYGVCALACPLGMGAMMWFMMRGRRNSHSGAPQIHERTSDQAQEEVERRRTGVESLREIQAEHDDQPTT